MKVTQGSFDPMRRSGSKWTSIGAAQDLPRYPYKVALGRDCTKDMITADSMQKRKVFLPEQNELQWIQHIRL